MSDRPHPTAATHRIAAALALLAAPCAVVVVLAAGARNLAELVLAVVGAAILVPGGWVAVSRRGPARAAGIVTVCAGLAIIVLSIVLAEIHWWVGALLVALLVISTSCARRALGLRDTDLVEAPIAGRPVGPARHPVLLINPKSGGGKGERFKLEDECAARGIEAVMLHPGDDLLELAKAAIGRGADVIGMAGGDGSQALVASVAQAHDVAHVVIPAGTRNHFALDLGLDRDDVVGALDAFAGGVERTIDLATVNGRVFVNNASLGLYARIVQSSEYRDAKLRTAMDMLPDLVGPDSTPLDLRFTGPDGAPHGSASVVLVSNNTYRLAGPGGMGTRERIDRGALGIATIAIDGTADAEKLTALAAVGQIERFGGWNQWEAPQFRIDSNGPVEVGVDGEAMVLQPPLVFASMPQALRIRLPLHAPGRSPAARRLGLMTGGELWRAAMGQEILTA